MITTTGAQELQSRVLRRIEDEGLESFQVGEVFDAVQSALGSIYTDLRLANKYHDTDYLSLTPAQGTSVRQHVMDFKMPEYVADVIELKGQRMSGQCMDLFNKVPVQMADMAVGAPRWHWIGARAGTIRVYGRLAPYSALVFFFARKWPPLHYGTAAGGGAQSITFTNAPTAGKIVRRDSIYVGMDVLITNNDPAGVQDQLRRVTAFDGATRVATVDEAWTVAPTANSQYGLVAPIPGEYEEMLIEETAQILKEELGEGIPISPRLMALRDKFQQGLSQRDGGPARRLFSRGL